MRSAFWVALLVGLALFASTAKAVTPQPDKPCTGVTHPLVCLINFARAERNIPKVHIVRKLMNSAQLKLDRIIACGEVSHTPCGDSSTRAFKQANYLPCANSKVREVLANKYGSARKTFHYIMGINSKKAIVLDPDFDDIGYAHSGTLWVVHLGHCG